MADLITDICQWKETHEDKADETMQPPYLSPFLNFALGVLNSNESDWRIKEGILFIVSHLSLDI
jgi:hypothetical protein